MNNHFFILLLLITGGGVLLAKPPSLEVTHGTAVSLHTNEACIWARTTREAIMQVWVVNPEDSSEKKASTPVFLERDFTGKVTIKGLVSDTRYIYYVVFKEPEEKITKYSPRARWGTFRTPPAAEKKKPVTFAWGGDLAGQNVCRDIEEGFPIFQAINQLPLDFFIGLGDMIYADNICQRIGRYGNRQIPGPRKPASNLAGFWKRWKYAREDQAFQELLSRFPYYAVWDDHEVVNDFGPKTDTRSEPPYDPDVELMPIGLTAFLDYNPIFEDDSSAKLYHHLRWGKHLEIFVLDTRQYRDANAAKDTPQNPKTMLSAKQKQWLKKSLQKSNATWKVIVSSVPIAIPTGYPPEKGRDGWADFDQDTGFEEELQEIFAFLKKNNLNQTVWLTTDVHFASFFRYAPYGKEEDFRVYECVTGPLHAGLFPIKDLDQTFAPERLFFYGPDTWDGLTYEKAREFMNFGSLEISAEGDLQIHIHKVDGSILFTHKLSPVKESKKQ